MADQTEHAEAGGRLTTTLPAMTLAEAIDTIHTHGIAGLTGGRSAA